MAKMLRHNVRLNILAMQSESVWCKRRYTRYIAPYDQRLNRIRSLIGEGSFDIGKTPSNVIVEQNTTPSSISRASATTSHASRHLALLPHLSEP
jgi:hypothetical protein